MYKLLIALLLFFCSLRPLPAQDSESYNQKYDWAGGYQEELPDFLFIPLLENEVVGVSDPGLKPGIAKEQAIQRALFLFALKQESTLNMLMDYFTINRVATNLYDYTHEKMMVMATLDFKSTRYSFSVTREYSSAFGEVFVCLSFKDQGDESRTISANCEFMIGFNHESHEQQEHKLLLAIQCKDHPDINNCFFSLKGNKSKQIIASRLNESRSILHTNIYRYRNRGDVAPNIPSYSLANAYWSAMMESLGNELTNFQSPEITIKQVFESYQDSNRQLNRAKINCKISATYIVTSIHNNNISINWSVKTVR